ncbi:hypothetical protein DFQ30_010083 [Apophysomyces sp. BC1015]|nr:hypothetical protein DFQ30_010083 [Apophysomyces sp. BC1015]
MSVSYCKPLSGRHSSSNFIAHLMLQDHPPKVQPRSSAARHGVSLKDLMDVNPVGLDTVDTEAGYILIALANHDLAQPDTNLSMENSIIVKGTTEQDAESMPSCSRSSSTSSTSSSGSGNSMSISNLLGNDDSPSSPALTSQKNQSIDGDGRLTEKIDQQDPIMLLAAAAAVISREDEEKTRDIRYAGDQKRKLHSDTSVTDCELPERRHREGQVPEYLWRRQEDEARGQFILIAIFIHGND